MLEDEFVQVVHLGILQEPINVLNLNKLKIGVYFVKVAGTNFVEFIKNYFRILI